MSTTDDLIRMLHSNLATVVTVCRTYGHEQWAYPARLLAIASREAAGENIEGDFGNGKGVFQIDRRSWAAWLQTHPGVRSGTWIPVEKGVSAYTAGYVPTLRDGLDKAISILSANWSIARSAGLSTHDAAWVMVSAYNCGPANALNGMRQRGNSDVYTTGGNYAHDVFARETEARQYLKRNGFLR